MKNNLIKTLVGSGLALAIAAAVWSPIFVSADQVKGAQLLIAKPASAATAAPATTAAPTMSCHMCKDESTSRVDTSARGASKPVVVEHKHLCPTCGDVIKTTGVGKQATQVVNHTCTMGGKELASCCK